MDSISSLLAKRIKTLRQERDLTQEYLALKADVNKSFMGEIERGIASPTIKTLEKIAIALDVTIAELLTFDASSDMPVKELECIEKINYELTTRSLKEQEAVYKLIKTFFNLVDKT